MVPDAIPAASAASGAVKSGPSSERDPIVWIRQQRKESKAFLCGGLIQGLFIKETSGRPQAQIRNSNVVEGISKKVSDAPSIRENEDFSGENFGMLREIPIEKG